MSGAPARLSLAQEQASSHVPILQTAIAAAAFLVVLAGFVYGVRNRRRDGLKERLAEAARVLRLLDVDVRRLQDAERPATTAELGRLRARRPQLERAVAQCPTGRTARRLRSRLAAVAEHLTRCCATGAAPLTEIEAAYTAAHAPDDVPAQLRLPLFAGRVRQQERALVELAVAVRKAEATVARWRRF
ncbi:hypothetical protein [Streptomyces sp. NPDC048521]|uniref:hypothetical protein n=1 Tax=Streptomyces sp. NPDC048521 TaxID=3365566 RepID=UPI0037102901